MSAKDDTMVAVHALEEVLRRHDLPALIIIGLPAEQSFIRLSGGLATPNNRELFRVTVDDLLLLEARKHGASLLARSAGKAIEFTHPLQECPVCNGSGQDPMSAAGNSSLRCRHCNGLGRLSS